MELEEYKRRLRDWESAIRATCPDERYSRTVVAFWCEQIAPNRAEEYGTEFWERFGPQGVFAQVMNCWYRWRASPHDVSHDTLVDTFGYAVLYAMSIGMVPNQGEWSLMWNAPVRGMEVEAIEGAQEVLIERCWFGRQHSLTSGRVMFAIAYNEWKVVFV